MAGFDFGQMLRGAMGGGRQQGFGPSMNAPGVGMPGMMGGGMPGGMQSQANLFGGADPTDGGGFGAWIRDPNNQQLIAGLLQGLGQGISSERSLRHQKDILSEERRQFDEGAGRRDEANDWVTGQRKRLYGG